MRYLVSLLVVVLMAASSLGASAGPSLDQHAAQIYALPHLERLFVLKTAENKLTERFKRIVSDPANKSDGHLWARKVFAASYLRMANFASSANELHLSDFYKQRSRLWEKHIRDEISTQEMESKERTIDRSQREYLEREFKIDPPTRRPVFAALEKLADLVSKDIYGLSVISAGQLTVRGED